MLFLELTAYHVAVETSCSLNISLFCHVLQKVVKFIDEEADITPCIHPTSSILYVQ
jgi:hypothetical protein